jgi:hypothetical protein
MLLQRDKLIPALAGMTPRSLSEARNFDFFTRSRAGMTLAYGSSPDLPLLTKVLSVPVRHT